MKNGEMKKNERKLSRVIRLLATIAGGVIGFGISLLVLLAVNAIGGSDFTMPGYVKVIINIAFTILFAFIVFMITPYLFRGGRKVADDIETDLRKVPSADLVAGAIGLVAGLLVAFLISQLWTSLGVFGIILSVAAYVFLGYLGVILATKRGKDLINLITQNRQSKASSIKVKTKNGQSSAKILDTSVIIDGRIADLLKTGFIEGAVIVPDFVVTELHHISDSSDALKRNRGRRGLDIVKKLQAEFNAELMETEGDKIIAETEEVDIKLLRLAQIIGGKVMTNDYNLNKVAAIQGVDVLNINELANTLKPVVLPGEELNLTLIKEGRENNQALAYLEDGTMIVVEEGKSLLGQTIPVTVTSVLQTSAGRMIFARPKSA